MNYIDLDFESRCALDITKVGAWKYAEHESCDALIMRYHIDNISHVWLIGQDFPEIIRRKIKRGWKLRAHNSFFEYCIWNLCMAPKYGWPVLPIESFECTQALVLTHSYQPSLDASGTQLHLEVQKNKRGKTLINLFCKPSKKDGAIWNEPADYPEDFTEFDEEYCDTDVVVQREIAEAIPPMSAIQNQSHYLIRHMMIRGVPVDLEMAQGAINMVDIYLERARIEASEITDGAIENVRSRNQVMDWLDDQDFPVDDTKGATLEKYIARKDIPDDCRRIAELKKNTGKSSTSKYAAAIRTAGDDSRVHGAIDYHIARTGRPGGRLLQVQNFYKTKLPKWVDYEFLAGMIANEEYDDIELLYGDLMNTLASACRSVIRAPKGKVFYVADYAQVECRIVFWLADEKDALKIMADDTKDIYCEMAGDIYKTKVTKENDTERFVGKQAILGLGYQMADERFKNRCADFDVIIEKEFSKNVVKIYRTKYKRVKALWKEMNDAAMDAVRNRGRKFYCADKKLYYQTEGKYLYCYLPSGRRIAYVEPMVKRIKKWGKEIPTLTYMGWNSGLRRWRRDETFGGKLLENACQAIVADIADDGTNRCNEKGYVVIFPVHDELIAETDEDFGSIEEYEELLSSGPEWSKGLPIKAEAWKGTRYKK